MFAAVLLVAAECCTWFQLRQVWKGKLDMWVLPWGGPLSLRVSGRKILQLYQLWREWDKTEWWYFQGQGSLCPLVGGVWETIGKSVSIGPQGYLQYGMEGECQVLRRIENLEANNKSKSKSNQEEEWLELPQYNYVQ